MSSLTSACEVRRAWTAGRPPPSPSPVASGCATRLEPSLERPASAVLYRAPPADVYARVESDVVQTLAICGCSHRAPSVFVFPRVAHFFFSILGINEDGMERARPPREEMSDPAAKRRKIEKANDAPSIIDGLAMEEAMNDDAAVNEVLAEEQQQQYHRRRLSSARSGYASSAPCPFYDCARRFWPPLAQWQSPAGKGHDGV